jgi:uncharacterized protein (DUF302 family)
MTLHAHGYGFGTTVSMPYEAAVERLRGELGKEGFGILTEIDVRATLKNKIDVDFRPYLILGACNPPLAHRALAQELEIGLLLPCNIIVYASDSEGESAFRVLVLTRRRAVGRRRGRRGCHATRRNTAP